MPALASVERVTERYTFDEFEIDVPAFELRRGGMPVPLEPQVFEVLLLLVRNGGRVLTKDEILDAIWPERYVTEAVLNSRVMSVRKALGDDGRTQRYIKTVHGRGYRFTPDGNPRDGAPEPLRFPSAPPDLSAGEARVSRPANVFIGREFEMARLRQLLQQRHVRLLSVVGPGGIGKTRLVTETLAGLELDAQVVSIPLQSVSDPRGAAFAMAAALGIPLVDTNHCEQIITALRTRDLVLFLDNFEQLVENTSGYVSELIRQAPGVRVVLTSRVPVNLAEEWLFRIEGLEFRGADSPAVALFRERAAQARAQADANIADGETVRALCESVAGMPLAIELAASLTRHHPVDEIATLIRERATALVTECRNIPERHRSVAALFDEAFERLSPAERDVLQSLSVFGARFSAEAAEAIAGAPAATLWSLVDRSLVHTADGRFDLHPLLRQYAADRCCDGMAELAERHARYFAHEVAARRDALEGPGQVEAVRDLDEVFDDVVRAWRWAVAAPDVQLLDEMLAMFGFLTFSGRVLEAEELAALAIPALEGIGQAAAATLAHVHVSHAWMLMRTGRPADAMAAARAALALYDTTGAEPVPGIGRDPRMPLAASSTEAATTPPHSTSRSRRARTPGAAETARGKPSLPGSRACHACVRRSWSGSRTRSAARCTSAPPATLRCMNRGNWLKRQPRSSRSWARPGSGATSNSSVALAPPAAATSRPRSRTSRRPAPCAPRSVICRVPAARSPTSPTSTPNSAAPRPRKTTWNRPANSPAPVATPPDSPRPHEAGLVSSSPLGTMPARAPPSSRPSNGASRSSSATTW